MYFIIIDEQLNIFCHYYSNKIDRIETEMCDTNIFLFTLNNNNRCRVKKFAGKEWYILHLFMMKINWDNSMFVDMFIIIMTIIEYLK